MNMNKNKQREEYERLLELTQRSKAEEKLFRYLNKEIQREEKIADTNPNNWLFDMVKQWSVIEQLIKVKNHKDVPSWAKLLFGFFIIIGLCFTLYSTIIGGITDSIELANRLAPTPTWTPSPTYTPSPTITAVPTLSPTPEFTPLLTATQSTLQSTTGKPSETDPTYLGIIFLFGILYFLYYIFIEAPKEAKQKRFEKVVMRLLDKQGVVCEYCLSTWTEFDVPEFLAKIYQRRVKNLDFFDTTSEALKNHLKMYHTRKSTNTDLVHLVKKPSWVKMLFKKEQ